ncbi:MAG TPA: hypothetical protein VNM15_09215 [Candidatus Binatia bacterium]|nr:hypothetical protein [Candidatus Binatia bacterium]
MEHASRLFEGDIIAPQQFREIFSRSRNLSPEQELMLAVLCDAIECILKYCAEPLPIRARLYEEAQEWVFTQDDKAPFSFLNVCDGLNLNPDYVRRGLLAKIREKTVNRAAPASVPSGTERRRRQSAA